MIAILTIALTMCVTTVSTCMEQEIKIFKQLAQEKPVIANQESFREICTAEQIGWEKLNEIMNAPYKNDLNIPLVPVYVQRDATTTNSKKDAKQQEIKPLLCTMTPAQPDNALMETMYNQTYRTLFMDTTDTLSALIDSLKKAKKEGLNEDIMGKFSLNQSGFLVERNHFIALFFGCLKHYSMTAATTHEQNPCHLNFLMQKFSKSTSIQQYPALSALYNDIAIIRQKADSICYERADHNSIIIRNAARFIYSQEELIKEYNTLMTDTFSDVQTLKQDMCKKAFSLCVWGSFLEALQPRLMLLIKATQEARTKKYIQDEHELGAFALKYRPTLVDAALMVFDEGALYTNDKRAIISILFELIRQYNNECYPAKKTPTQAQINCINRVNELNIALPDSFDKNLLDCQYVAFTEYQKLFDNVEALLKSNQQDRDECVKFFYPEYKFVHS